MVEKPHIYQVLEFPHLLSIDRGQNMRYAICDATGSILGFRDISAEDLKHYSSEILHGVDLTVTEDTHYIDGGEVVQKPQRPSASHEWSMDTKEWILNPEKAWSAVRHQRDTLIAATDWMVLPDAPFTESEIVEIKEYRQALRDITEQPDPLNIEWPEKPEVII